MKNLLCLVVFLVATAVGGKASADQTVSAACGDSVTMKCGATACPPCPKKPRKKCGACPKNLQSWVKGTTLACAEIDKILAGLGADPNCLLLTEKAAKIAAILEKLVPRMRNFCLRTKCKLDAAQKCLLTSQQRLLETLKRVCKREPPPQVPPLPSCDPAECKKRGGTCEGNTCVVHQPGKVQYVPRPGPSCDPQKCRKQGGFCKDGQCRVPYPVPAGTRPPSDNLAAKFGLSFFSGSYFFSETLNGFRLSTGLIGLETVFPMGDHFDAFAAVRFSLADNISRSWGVAVGGGFHLWGGALKKQWSWGNSGIEFTGNMTWLAPDSDGSKAWGASFGVGPVVRYAITNNLVVRAAAMWTLLYLQTGALWQETVAGTHDYALAEQKGRYLNAGELKLAFTYYFNGL